MDAETPRKLYKSRRNRFIDGICGGIAEYFEVDPTIVRLLWVLVTLLGGSGIILYIIGMIVIPVNPEHLGGFQTAPKGRNGDRRRFFGVVLMLVGALVLIINLGWFSGLSWWSFSGNFMLPALLIIIGGLFIYLHATGKKQAPAADPTAAAAPPKELKRSISDRKLLGVCGGIARYFDIDSTIVRFLFVFMVLGSFGWALLLYILMAIIVPEDKPTVSSA